MEIIQYLENGQKISEILSNNVVIKQTQDALDLIASPGVVPRIILHKENLAPEFFDLKTGLAGEILQKFSNYHIKAAIIGDFSNVKSSSLNAFIIESNRGSQVGFVENLDLAKKFLTKI